MQAIITKVIPATNTKATRIKARCSRGHHTYQLAFLQQATHVNSWEESHRAAALALLKKFRDEDAHPPQTSVWDWPLITSQLHTEEYVHVFVNPREWHPAA